MKNFADRQSPNPMLNRTNGWISAIVIAAVGCHSARATEARGPCDDSLTRDIPARAPSAPGGRAFAEEVRGLADDERESYIQHELLAGNIPGFLRRFMPVRLPSVRADGSPADVVICVAPDYLAIGSDDDFLLMPMRLGTALSMATTYGFTLPTPRMVDEIYAQAGVQFVPQPLPAGNQMRSTEYLVQHSDLIGGQREVRRVLPGALIAGDKKDLVLTNQLWSHLDRVAIYGWHLANGKPIQPVSTVHGWRYADYSHGVRLISDRVFVDGKSTPIFTVLQNPRLAAALSEEGAIDNLVGLITTLKARSPIAAMMSTAQTRVP
jgi:hypothetical protein